MFRRFLAAATAGRRDADAETFMTRAMSIGTTTEGGFAVPEQLDPQIVWLDAGTLNAVRRIARVVTATGDNWEGLTGTPGTWSWDAEAAEVSDDSATIGRPAVPIHMARGFIPFSIEVQGDYPGFMEDMRTALVRGRDTLEGDTHIDGTGSGQPTGITVALAGGAREIDTATSVVFAIADVFTTQETLAARYRSNATWLMHNAIGNAVRQFDTAGGAALWERIGADRPAQLLGRPVVESEEMDSDPATAGQEIAVFGDFSNYVIADRIGMNVELVPHLFSTTTNLPDGQRGLFAYFRSGADSINDLGFVQLQVSV
jgi:HK97 family phage major capsid protein